MIKHSSREQNNKERHTGRERVREREGNTSKKSEIFHVLWQINAQSPRTSALWVAPKTIKGGPTHATSGNMAIVR